MEKKGKHSKKKESNLKIHYKILEIGFSICVCIVIGIILYSHNMQSKEEADEHKKQKLKDDVEYLNSE